MFIVKWCILHVVDCITIKSESWGGALFSWYGKFCVYKVQNWTFISCNEWVQQAHTHTLTAEYGTAHTNVNYFLLCCCCCVSVSFLHLNFCLHSTKCGGADEWSSSSCREMSSTCLRARSFVYLCVVLCSQFSLFASSYINIICIWCVLLSDYFKCDRLRRRKQSVALAGSMTIKCTHHNIAISLQQARNLNSNN